MGSHSAGRHSRHTNFTEDGQPGPRRQWEDSDHANGLRPTKEWSFGAGLGDEDSYDIDSVSGPLSRSSARRQAAGHPRAGEEPDVLGTGRAVPRGAATGGRRSAAGGRAAHRAPTGAARGAGRARLAVAGTASLAGLGAFVTGMALSSPSDTGPIQAFGSPGGAASTKVDSGPSPMDAATSQASRDGRSGFPLASPQIAPLVPQDGAAAPEELPNPLLDPQVVDGEPYGVEPDEASDQGMGGWSMPLVPLEQPTLTPSPVGADTTGLPPTSAQSSSPLPGNVPPPAEPNSGTKPNWLAEPPWVPPSGTSLPATRTVPVTPLTKTPPTTTAPATPPKPPPAPATRYSPPPPSTHPAPAPPPAPSTSSPQPSGTTLPFQPVLDGEIVAGTQFFQLTPTPLKKVSPPPSSPSAPSPSAPSPAPVWPHD